MTAISHRSGLRASMFFMLALVLLLRADVSEAAAWEIGVVDAAGVGRFSSLKFDKDGNAHVAYVMEGGRFTLKYGFWDHTLNRWFTMPVSESASFCSLVLDSKQRPHISYADYGTAKGSKLRYAHWDGTAWKTEAIQLSADVIAYYTSIALDVSDKPTISYYEYEGPGGIGYTLRLRTVSWNGTRWEGRTIDATPGSGKFNFLVADSGGGLQIAYANVKAEYASLRYGRWNGQSWATEVLEGSRTPFYVYSVAAGLDAANNPHIVYTDVANRLVKYTTRRDGKWELQVVDSMSKEAYPDRNGIAVDSEGKPYVSYYDAALGTLKVATRSGSRWITETVDQDFAGFGSSLQIDRGFLWVTYADERGGALKFARKALVAEGLPAPQADPVKSPPEARRGGSAVSTR